MKSGTIAQINKTGHQWHGRSVVVDTNCDGFLSVQLPEQQSLPAGKRLVCMLHESCFTSLSVNRQQQIANSIGLRLESLPYGSHEVLKSSESIGQEWDAFFAN